MNICPHCGAPIGENVRFCTACMTPLNQKRVIVTPKYKYRRWLPVAVAVLVFILVVGAVVWLTRPQRAVPAEQTSASVATQPDGIPNSEKSTTASGGATTSNSVGTGGDATVNSSSTTSTSVGTGSDTTAGGSTTTSNSTTTGGDAIVNSSTTSMSVGTGSDTTASSSSTTRSSTKTGSYATTNGGGPIGSSTTSGSVSKTDRSTKTGSTTKKGSTKTSSTTKAGSTTTVSDSIKTTGSTGPSSNTKTSHSTENGTTTTNSVTAVTYLYRDARAGDDFAVFANLENAVVITGVSTPAADGVYIIPETLGGKRVLAIMGNAFCSNDIKDTVKTVVVPASVKTIWNYAFSSCHYLTDIYFLGDAVYTESNAFADPAKRAGTLTIHCSADCNDRNLRYYKNSASRYHAQYKELSDTDYASMRKEGRSSMENEIAYSGGGQ